MPDQKISGLSPWPVKRIVRSKHHGNLVMVANDQYVTLAPSGSRTVMGTVSWGAIYLLLAKQRGDEIIKQRRANRRRSRR